MMEKNIGYKLKGYGCPKKNFKEENFMRINTNLMAMNSNRQLNVNSNSASKSMEKLSSGLRINRAGDDAAGLAISEKMRGQIRGLNQGAQNAQEGISLVQTAEGALNQTHDILQRMRELAVQGSNDALEDADRGEIDKEFQQLFKEVDDISTTTQFNKQNLLDGSFSGKQIQTGANASDLLSFSIADMSTTGLSMTGAATGTFTAANAAVTTIEDAIKTVSDERASLGATQNRLEYKIKNLNSSSENLTSAESQIRDVDMATEMVNYTKNDILQQAAQAMLSKANQAPQNVLQLLR